MPHNVYNSQGKKIGEIHSQSEDAAATAIVGFGIFYIIKFVFWYLPLLVIPVFLSIGPAISAFAFGWWGMTKTPVIAAVVSILTLVLWLVMIVRIGSAATAGTLNDKMQFSKRWYSYLFVLWILFSVPAFALGFLAGVIVPERSESIGTFVNYFGLFAYLFLILWVLAMFVLILGFAIPGFRKPQPR